MHRGVRGRGAPPLTIRYGPSSQAPERARVAAVNLRKLGYSMDRAVDVLEAMRALAPKLAERAREVEQLGTFPQDLYDDFVATGVLRMSVPEQFGGYELSLAETNPIVIEAARADGSAGWLAMIAQHLPGLLLKLNERGYNELFADGPDCHARLAGAPTGVAVPTDGGYILSGKWAFASGGPGSKFLGGGGVVLENGEPKMTPLGLPEMVIALMKADEVEFLDTWHVIGMKGSDSRDFVANEVFVPTHRTGSLFGSSSIDTTVGRLPALTWIQPAHASVALGIALGAIDDICALAPNKHPAFNPTVRVADDPLFQQRLGEVVMELEAASALLDRETQSLWETALAGRQIDRTAHLRAHALGAFVTATSTKVVDTAYGLAGGSAVYETLSLQRRLRDIHTITQHFGVSTNSYGALGAQMVGADVHPMALL